MAFYEVYTYFLNLIYIIIVFGFSRFYAKLAYKDSGEKPLGLPSG